MERDDFATLKLGIPRAAGRGGLDQDSFTILCLFDGTCGRSWGGLVLGGILYRGADVGKS